MRIWRSHELGDPLVVLRLEEDDAPGEPGPSQVLIDTAAVGLTFPDVLSCRGEYQVPTRLPYTPGGEIAGVVSAVGEGVDLEVGTAVAVLGGGRSVVESVAPAGGGPVAAVVPDLPEAPSGEIRCVPLGTILGSRSGDKGGNANLGVFARSIEAYAWMAQELTVERMRELLPEAAGLSIDRHELPNLWSLNFVIHGILQEGVAASTRQDGQAKSLGEWFRARHADIPVRLL